MRDPTEVTATIDLRPESAWGRAKKAPFSDTGAAFAAGAALGALDALVRTEPMFAGVWRQRFALSAAFRATTRTAPRDTLSE